MSDKELFLRSAKEIGIQLENYSITKVTDYRKTIMLLNNARNYKVMFGMDMYSGTCSGKVEITGIETKHIRLIEKDNGCDDYFKFKSMLILNGDINNPNSSPELFFEAEQDVEWLKKYKDRGYSYIVPNRYLGLEIEDGEMVVYDREKIEEYLNLEEQSYYNSDIVVPRTRKIVRNTESGMVVYANIQECKERHRGNVIIYKAQYYDSDYLLKCFSKEYKVIMQ